MHSTGKVSDNFVDNFNFATIIAKSVDVNGKANAQKDYGMSKTQKEIYFLILLVKHYNYP